MQDVPQPENLDFRGYRLRRRVQNQIGLIDPPRVGLMVRDHQPARDRHLKKLLAVPGLGHLQPGSRGRSRGGHLEHFLNHSVGLGPPN